MQPQGISRKKVLLIFIISGVILVGFGVLISILTQKDENQFGKFIRIQNYNQKVKNIPGDMRDATEASLYNTVERNVDITVINPSTVRDAYIREGSDSQTYTQESTTYYGKFIVDMESIKQSYQVQYSYSKNPEGDIGGNPVIISCLPKKELRYGDFKCTDPFSEQSNNDDQLLQYLPYENFSFKLSPDATQGDSIVIIAKLTIPDSDLRGGESSRIAVVSLYKQQVVEWLESKGIDTTKYIIQYNYDDSGNLIPKEPTHGD